MPWVITSLCRDCVEMSCVEVCPVDCIYEYTGSERASYPNQLFINPDECIDCSVCEPDCPWEAIFEDQCVPDVFTPDIALNASVTEALDDFEVPAVKKSHHPTPEQVQDNKAKWGYNS